MNFLVGVCLAILVFFTSGVEAQTLTTSNVQITWKVVNRFRLFKDPDTFKQQENAWRQYGTHVNQRSASTEDNAMFYYNSSVLGIEHVLNDRRIPFTNILRTKFDWRGWAAKAVDSTCWNEKERRHTACGDEESYINPKSHEIELHLKPERGGTTIAEYNCEWRIGDAAPLVAGCDEAVRAQLPYPEGASISVNVQGEQAISIDAKVKDLLIVGFGDSYASGEGNPDMPVELDENKRSNNLYPARAGGSAQWLDQLCHRSLYSHQLRSALQIGIENPHGAVTFMGYACSGAAVEKGLLGPQKYVEYVSQQLGGSNADGQVQAQPRRGGGKDSQLYWFLREVCLEDVQSENGFWVCPNNHVRRNVDFVFLSVGGNDVGFADLVAWSTLREGFGAKLAGLFGATISPDQFADRLKNVLPAAYAKLARALERSIPLPTEGLVFDPSRIVLTAYPDILIDEEGKTCAGIGDGAREEDEYPSNQTLDRFKSWLVVSNDKLDAAHAQLDRLHRRMGELAEANGWTYAGRAYVDQPFRGHGFCARRRDRMSDPAEVLMVPCWGKASRPTQSCQPGILGVGKGWRPYDPATENYPYALRQRWVRTFNDAFMVMNQKVVDKFGKIDEDATATNFAETTGGMHPSAEGHASMADAILIDLRDEIAKIFAE